MAGNSITVRQGKDFKITLKQASGTNYSWCLTTMPEGIAMVTTDVVPQAPGVCGGPVSHIFYFLALGSKPVKLEFAELNLTTPSLADAKKVEFDIQIIPANQKSAANSMTSFVEYAENAAVFEPEKNAGSLATTGLKYGYPSNPCVKYGYPPMVKYGYYGCTDDSCTPATAANMAIPYGYPVNTLYGYPPQTLYGYPPQMLYGYPPCT